MKYLLLLVLAFGLGACGHVKDASSAPPATAQAHTPAQAGSLPPYVAKYPAPVQALVDRGMIIRGSLPAPPGYTGYVGQLGGDLVPVYLLPDHQHTVIGELVDASGKSLSLEPMREATTPTLDAATWKRLGQATWIAEGARHPKHIVYEFLDTECPYCHSLWQATQPLLTHGDLQVRYIIAAMIAPQSTGRAAALLGSRKPAAALRRHELEFGNSPIKPLEKIPAATAKRIQANNALMSELGVNAIPVVVYKDKHDRIRMVVGPSPDRIPEIFGDPTSAQPKSPVALAGPAVPVE